MAIGVKTFPKDQPVDYDTFRQQIETGDILLCSGSGWFSKMIQGSTESVWSHVGFVMRLDTIDRVMVLESVEPLGVRTVPLRKYLKDYDSQGNPYPGGLILARHQQFEARAKAKALSRFGQFAVDLFGYPYDKDEIAKIAARIMASHIPFSAKDKKALAPDREYICSEYAYECYKSIGIEIDYDPRGFVAPADFARTQEISLVAVLQGKK